MTEHFTPDLEPFVRQAMEIAGDRSITIRLQRADFERLVVAISVYAKESYRQVLKKQAQEDADYELRHPRY